MNNNKPHIDQPSPNYPPPIMMFPYYGVIPIPFPYPVVPYVDEQVKMKFHEREFSEGRPSPNVHDKPKDFDVPIVRVPLTDHFSISGTNRGLEITDTRTERPFAIIDGGGTEGGGGFVRISFPREGLGN